MYIQVTDSLTIILSLKGHRLNDVRSGKGVLVIEHMNHSSKLFGLIKKGDQEEIPFSMIANSKVFMLFFEDFVAKTLK